MTDPTDPRTADDPTKLRTLADWFDMYNPNDQDPEVQRDLRRIAVELVGLRAELQTARADTERYRQGWLLRGRQMNEDAATTAGLRAEVTDLRQAKERGAEDYNKLANRYAIRGLQLRTARADALREAADRLDELANADEAVHYEHCSLIEAAYVVRSLIGLAAEQTEPQPAARSFRCTCPADGWSADCVFDTHKRAAARSAGSVGQGEHQ